jgi:hypothetical protein
MPQKLPKITKVTIHVAQQLTPKELLDLMNTMQGHLNMGSDDLDWDIDPKMNIEVIMK